MQSLSLKFSESVRVLSHAARTAGMTVPTFRSPPTDPMVIRSVKKRSDGTTMVAVRITGRPFAEVQADLIEGFMVANDIPTENRPGLRTTLREALTRSGMAD